MCYWCGCLTHPNKDCEKWIESEGSLSKEDQHSGPWLRAAPFTASRKEYLSVLGFDAHKKVGKHGLNQTKTQYQPQNPPTTMACESSQNLQPKNMEQNVNHTSENSAKVTASNSIFSEPSFLVHPLKPTHPIMFDQLIAEIDRDIHYFDRVDPAQDAPNASTPTGNLGQCQGGGPFIVTLQKSDGDIRKVDGKKYGGISEVIEMSNHNPLHGRDQIKEGEGGVKGGPGTKKPFGLNAIGPKLSTDQFSSACLEADRPSSPPHDLSNAPGPLLNQQVSLGSKWTRLTRSAHEPKVKVDISNKLRERPAVEPSDH